MEAKVSMAVLAGTEVRSTSAVLGAAEGQYSIYHHMTQERTTNWSCSLYSKHTKASPTNYHYYRLSRLHVDNIHDRFLQMTNPSSRSRCLDLILDLILNLLVPRNTPDDSSNKRPKALPVNTGYDVYQRSAN